MSSKNKGKFKETEIGTIPEDWEIDNLGNNVEKIFCGRDPSGGKQSHSDRITQYRIIQSAPVFDGYLDKDKVGFISKNMYSNLESASLKEDDVLLNQLGDGITFARSCVVPKEVLPSVITRSVGCIRCNKGKLDPWYLNAFLILSKTKRYIESFNSGSSRRAIDGSKMRSFIIPLPPINEQREIGQFYRLIQNKIELNQQMNKTIENIGQALFKHWFIDFEFPNEKGKPYKSNGGGMVDSELGEIPKGWEKGSVSDLVNHSKDTISPNDSPEKIFFHYSIPSYDEGKWPSMEKGKFIKSNKFLVKSNSILVSKLNPRMPRIWAAGEVDESCSVCSTEFQVLVPKKKWNYNYVYFSFSSGEITDEMKSLVTGTSSSHQRVRPEDMLNLKIVIPDENVLQKFEYISFCLRQKMWQIYIENKHLCSIRDSLLPKLMSGQIRVPAG